MSYKMPNSSGRNSLSLIMLMRTWESERIISDQTLDEEAVITAKRTARASPMRADETEERETLRDGILVPSNPENRPPIP